MLSEERAKHPVLRREGSGRCETRCFGLPYPLVTLGYQARMAWGRVGQWGRPQHDMPIKLKNCP
jgi:hypothetical protein